MARLGTGLVFAWGLLLILGATACGGSAHQAVVTPTAAAPEPAAAKPAAASATSAVASAPAGQVPTDPRPTPVEENYKGGPAEGDGTDPALNRLKNRVDDGSWQAVSVPALLDLRWPRGVESKHMTQWARADLEQVAAHNGVPVQTEGYLLQVRQEGPESPNCHSSDPTDMDFHTWLGADAGDDRATRSVVIEFTPRIRAKHASWSLAALQGLARQKAHVRVSGWTMLDPEHPDEVGKSRGTIWEIHPVMHLEVQQASGGWQEL